MKKLFQIALAGGICLAFSKLNAQSVEEVGMYGQYRLNGSARYVGMGGAFNSLGGDLSAISNNPAGTAVFLKSEFSFSLGINTNATKAAYLSKKNNDFGISSGIPTLGGVFAIKSRNENSKWKSINFGATINKLADFKNSQTIIGKDDLYSMGASLANQAKGFTADTMPFPCYVAYQVYVINPTDTSSKPNYVAGLYNNVNQNITINQKGTIGEGNISLGANYNNKWYFGGAIGIVSSDYTLNETFKETADVDTNDLKSWTYKNDVSAKGTGLNLKLGFIYRVADNLRFGLSYKTPTVLNISETYSTSASALFNSDPPTESYEAPPGSFSYKLVIPSKIGAGVSYLFGNIGLISLDYERSDLSKSKFKNDKYSGFAQEDFSEDNTKISNLYQATNTLKIGAEVRINAYVLRAGFGYTQQAYNPNETLKSQDTYTYSLGAGYKGKSFFGDFGLGLGKYKSQYTPYKDAEIAIIDHSVVTSTVTIGFKF